MSTANDFVNTSLSEFGDSYDDPIRPSNESFSSELLEQSVEVLHSPKPCLVEKCEGRSAERGLAAHHI